MDLDELKKNLDNIEEISDEDLKKMDFYETALYVQTLNQMEEIYDELGGDDDE